MKTNTPLPVAPYTEQASLWPQSGRHVLAHYDADTIVVYQAYRPAIGQFAIQHGVFGGEFSYSRMSWIKPNFLWMMYRCGWGQKANQEITLGLRISRAFFDQLLEKAVVSSFQPDLYPTEAAWKEAVAGSDVRLQWDPDHDPRGHPLERRAIQLGLRGETLAAFGKKEILEVIDMSDFVAEQLCNVARPAFHCLLTPVERVYETASGRKP